MCSARSPSFTWKRTGGSPHEGTLRVITRPTGTEYFAGEEELTTRFPPPDGWDERTEVCGRGSSSLQLLQRLERLDLERYPALRQLLIRPDELVLTFNCGQADRQTYRILRSATFDPDLVTDGLVRQTLAALEDIGEALSGAEEETRAYVK